MKKPLSWMLICALFLTLMPAVVLADEENPDAIPAEEVIAEEPPAEEEPEAVIDEEPAAEEEPEPAADVETDAEEAEAAVMAAEAEAAVVEEAAPVLDGEPVPDPEEDPSHAIIVESQPKNLTVNAGEKACFTVVVTGNNLHYQWQYLDERTNRWCDIAGATDATLSFTAKTSYDGFFYQCQITNDYGIVPTFSARLTVNSPISITSRPQDVTVSAGERAVFTVGAEGSGLSYQWQYYNGYTGKWVDIAGATYATMYFAAQGSYNGIYYHCVITDGSGNTAETNYVKLTVIAPIEITSQPKNVSVSVGETAVFTVAASVSGLSYQWQYYNVYTGKWISLAGAYYATMYFTARQIYDGIYYHCVITDGNGNKATSNYVKLTVSDAITITSQPQNVTVTAGDRATFRVGATGSDLSYQWQYYNGYTYKWVDIAGATYATMYFPAKDSYNGIYYHCVIKDSSGNTAYSNYVKLTVTAGEPLDGAAYVPASQSFYIDWTGYGDVLYVSLIKHADQIASDTVFTRFDTEYTDVLVEGSGLTVLSQTRTATSEELRLRLKSGTPEGRAASLTLRVMDGSKEKAAYRFYFVKTDRGFFGGSDTVDMWSRYYVTLRNEGVYNDFDMSVIVNYLQKLAKPIMDYPIPNGADPTDYYDPKEDRVL